MERLGGFSGMRYGEDIDFSIRIMEAGYRTRLFPSAWVYHKRRTDLTQFFRQVRHSGRPDRVEPETSRLIEAGTLLTGIIHVFSLSIGYRLILFAACFWCLLLFMPFYCL